MNTRRIMELLGLIAVGDAVIALAAPRRHCLLWRVGPAGFEKTVDWFADRPGMVRAWALAELAGGLALAMKQYSAE